MKILPPVQETFELYKNIQCVCALMSHPLLCSGCCPNVGGRMLGWKDPSWHSSDPMPFSGKRKRIFRSHSFRKPEVPTYELHIILP